MQSNHILAFLLLASLGQLNAEEALSKSLSCPDVNSGVPVFLPSTTNCAEYFVCDHGVPILMQCPEGLYWDQSKNVCNWPDQISPPCTGKLYYRYNSYLAVFLRK